jgi:hypothetical protein
MIREKDRWWWNCPNQRIANLAKCEIVAYDKKFQLWMGIEFDLR